MDTEWKWYFTCGHCHGTGVMLPKFWLRFSKGINYLATLPRLNKWKSDSESDSVRFILQNQAMHNETEIFLSVGRKVVREIRGCWRPRKILIWISHGYPRAMVPIDNPHLDSDQPSIPIHGSLRLGASLGPAAPDLREHLTRVLTAGSLLQLIVK